MRLGLSRLLHLPLLAFLLLVAAAGCDFVEGLSETPTAPPSSPTAAPTVVPTPTSSAGPGRTSAPSASGIVLSVLVAEAHSGTPEYNRREWRHWTDEDGDCQNARQEALIAESTIAVTFQSSDQCRVESGRWQGPYTGEIVADPGELDIDHMVPLENAHRSGGWAWDRERKEEYANFLGYENHLIATTASANRSKGSKGPEAWRPPLESYWCSYAVDWATVKSDWGLSVTESEFAALSEMLATCPTTVLLQPIRGESAPTLPAATSRPTPPPDLRYDPFGPDRNCSDFDTYEEALAFFTAAGGPDDDPHNLDVNGDGEPCESLPGGPSARESPPQDTATVLYPALRQGAPIGDGDCPSGATSEMDCEPQPSATSTPTPEPSPEPSPSIPMPPPAATVVPLPTPTPTPQPSPTPSPTPTSALTPEQASTPEDAFVDRDCGDFNEWREAQAFYLSEGGPGADPHSLDGDGDGVACQSLPGAPQPAASPTPEPTPAPSSESTPVSMPQPAPAETSDEPTFVGLPFDPYGPDRNCGDFDSWWDAQNFYFAAGGPDEDPHGLDRNGDGIVCESLTGAPGDATEESSSSGQSAPAQPTPEAEEFQDRNCSDFDTWRQAQDFFEAEGGPSEDPHGLDRNGDGIACESLPGAPGNG